MIEIAKGVEKNFEDSMHEAAKISGGFKTFLSESTSGAEWEIAKYVAMLSNRLASVRGASPVRSSASVLKTRAAVACTAQSTSVGSSSKEGLL